MRTRKARSLGKASLTQKDASMGPRSCERGKHAMAERGNRTFSLQWGRVHANAERPSILSTTRQPLGRFNGAAFMRTRKASNGRNKPPKNRASMGPRSCERGKNRDLGRRPSRVPRFNGAAFMRTRKALLAGSLRSAQLRLQWGRVHANAESCVAQMTLAVDRVASMGPRSCERGKRFHWTTFCHGPFGFNGAAFMRTRKGFICGRWEE